MKFGVNVNILMNSGGLNGGGLVKTKLLDKDIFHKPNTRHLKWFDGEEFAKRNSRNLSRFLFVGSFLSRLGWLMKDHRGLFFFRQEESVDL